MAKAPKLILSTLSLKWIPNTKKIEEALVGPDPLLDKKGKVVSWHE